MVVRFPALSISIVVTSASFLLLFCFAAAGWPGSAASNCFEDYLETPDCYCERLRGEKPGDVWIAQPINTLTNLSFVFGGLLIAYSADTRAFPSKEWWMKSNLMTQDKLYPIVLALNACLLGVGSSFLHASFTTWGRQLDMIAMYLLGTSFILYPLLRMGIVNKQEASWIYCFMNLCLIHWTVNIATPEQTRRLFTTLIAISWVIELFMVDTDWAKRNKKARQLFFANGLMFVTAALQWKASESGGPLCAPDSLWQGHSLWHFQSAMGICGEFFYYLAEEGTPATKSILVEDPHAMVTRNTAGAESNADGTFSGAQSVSSHTLSDSESVTSSEAGRH